jgi:hypothetical protein
MVHGVTSGILCLSRKHCTAILRVFTRIDIIIDYICSKNKKWKHEDASEMMFDDLVDKNDIRISKEDADFVKALIAGDPDMTGYVKCLCL